MKRFLKPFALLSALTLACVAFAQDAGVPLIPDPGQDGAGFLKLLLTELQGSHWKLLAATVVVGLVWVVRTFGGKYIPFLNTDRGGAVLALIGGILTATCDAVFAGGAFNLNLIISGLSLGFTAAGGFSVLKRIIAPPDKAKPPAVAAVK